MIKFKLGNIPIIIYPFFWLLAAIISWMSATSVSQFAIWMGVIFCSILIHELGHALTAQRFGQRVFIEFMAFGGLTQRSGTKLRSWQDFIIVLNGPLAGLSLALLAWVLSNHVPKSSPGTLYALTVTFYINTFWTVLNLLPVQPLDGSKLLSIVLEGFFGLRGTKIALFISFTLALVLGMLFFIINAFIAGAMFFMLAFESYRVWKESLVLTAKDKDFVLQLQLKEAELDLHQGRKDIAYDKLTHIREIAKAGVIYVAATEQCANILGERGENEAAYDLLEPIQSKLSPEGLRLLHQLAYRQGKWQQAVLLGDKTFQYFPSYDVAFINALSHSLLGHVKPAVGWLQCALQYGMPNLQTLIGKKEFDAIRQDPLFIEFQKQLASE